MVVFPKLMMWLAACCLVVMLTFAACGTNDPLARKFAEQRKQEEFSPRVPVSLAFR